MPVKTQREFDIFQELLEKYHHISAERVCSGKGLKNLYEAICTIDNIDCDEAIEPSTITKNALNGSCKASIESLDLMCAFLGRVAGNIALHLKARSGIYIAGGIPPKLGEYFFKSRFVEEFTAKGRMSDWISDIPVYMIDHPSVAMVGLQHHSTTL
jgi:glucokinase